MTEDWLSARRDQSLITTSARRSGVPLYTLYLAELVRQVGGELYFLREVGSLAGIYHSIALKLEAEYTLGYYPKSDAGTPGWRKVKVELQQDARIPAESRLAYRATYYVPASLR